MKNFLLFDVNFLAHRAFHSTGGLSNNGDPTGVLFGVFRAFDELQDRFATNRVAFCFDHGRGLREQACPFYKESRRKRTLTEQQDAALQGFRHQVEKLKFEYLNRMGYKNINYKTGYEADDVIAAIIKGNKNNEFIIISADHDLYQLLSQNVSMWNPITHTLMTKVSFKKKYGITPRQWIAVKAIAGCSSDDIPGVRGVGETTAIKYIRGELAGTSAAYKNIQAAAETIAANYPLIELPYSGLKTIPLLEDNLDIQQKHRVYRMLGFRSMMPV